MQRMECRRVSFSLDVNEKFPEVSFVPEVINKPRSMSSINKNGSSSSSSTVKMFQCVKTGVAKAIRLVSKKRASGKKNSSASNVVVPDHQHHYFVPHRDSHHSEAMDDCIEFVNSSYRKSM